MESTIYEKTYVCVRKAEASVKELGSIINLLKENPEGLTCKQMGTMLWGAEKYSSLPERDERHGFIHDNYVHNCIYHSLSSTLGHALAHLKKNKFITAKRVVTDEPILDQNGNPVCYEEWVEDLDTPVYIKAWDAKGREYTVHNPDYKTCHGYWKKTPLFKKNTIYKWVEEN